MNTFRAVFLFGIIFINFTKLYTVVGRQIVDDIRYNSTTNLNLVLSENYKILKSNIAGRAHVNCGTIKRECLGGNCIFNYSANGSLSNVQFEKFKPFPNCVDPGTKTCLCSKRASDSSLSNSVAHHTIGSAISVEYDTNFEIIVLATSLQRVEFLANQSDADEKGVEFFVLYKAPCCPAHEQRLTYAVKTARHGDREDVLLSRKTDAESNPNDAIKLFFKITDLKLEDSGIYTMHIMLNNSNLRLIYPFELSVKQLHMENVLIVDESNRTISSNRFLTKSKTYRFTWVAKGGLIKGNEFRIFWARHCRNESEYESVYACCCPEQQWVELTDRATVHSGSYRKEIDLNFRIEKSGVLKFAFANEERRVGYFASELSGNEETGYEIRTSSETPLEGSLYDLYCSYQPEVYRFLHWDIQNDNRFKTTWIVNTETKNLPFQCHVNVTSETNAVAVLTNRHLLLNDTGKYFCRLQRVGHVTTSDANTFVKDLMYDVRVRKPEPPRFADNTVEYLSINFTDDRVIACDVSGLPNPNIVWLKDGRRLDEAQHVRDDSSNRRLNLKRAFSGNYSCVATNSHGTATKTFMVTILGEPLFSRSIVLYVALIVLGVLLLALIVVVLLLWKKMHKKAKITKLHKTLMNSAKGILAPMDKQKPINVQPESLPFNLDLEVERDRLLFEPFHVLGEGQYGKVVEGTLTAEDNMYTYQVAIKMPRDGSNPVHMKALLSELLIMTNIGSHVNILSVLGVVTKRMIDYELYLVLELCKFGSLQTYVQSVHKNGGFINEMAPDDSDGYVKSRRFITPETKKSVSPTYVNAPLLPRLVSNDILCTSDLVKFAYQIASGMEFLSSKNLIHRDLALRNILLTERLIVKIADFGLALHDEFSPKKNKLEKLPLKWMALESILYDEFTPMSDVWSFGIVLYEMFTLGGVPYPDKAPDQNFIQWLKQGNRLTPPDKAPISLAEIMTKCWRENPESRPNFSEIKTTIEDLLFQQFPLAYQQLKELLTLADYNYVNIRRPNSVTSSTNPTAPVSPVENPNYLLTPASSNLSLSASNHIYLNQRSPLAPVQEGDDEVFFPQEKHRERERQSQESVL